jgi:hypothetical protein
LTRRALTITLLLVLLIPQAACEGTEAFPPPSDETVRVTLSTVALKSEDLGPDWSPRTLKFVPDDDTDAQTRADLQRRGVIGAFVRSDFPQRRSPDDRVHSTLVEQTLTAFRSMEQAKDWTENYPSLENRLGTGTQVLQPLRPLDDGPGEARYFARLTAAQSDSDIYFVIMRRGIVTVEIAASYPKGVDLANEMFEVARTIDDRIVQTSVFP